jgi:acetylornithine deacetylase/succinyl-diaminopimelate desuccinylase-like protein
MIVPAEQQATSDCLRAHVAMLAGRIGERNYMRLAALDSAADYMHATLASLGYTVTEQRYTAGSKTFRNIEAVLPGRARPDEIIVVGGHYDSVFDSPGADDNASGAAAESAHNEFEQHSRVAAQSQVVTSALSRKTAEPVRRGARTAVVGLVKA